MQDLTSKALRGLRWTYGAAIVSSVVQIGYSAVMARLLDPAAFGLLAMGLAALRFGTYFGQMGVGSAVVQKKGLQPEEIRASFTSSVVLGIVFFVVFLVAAPLVGRAYGSPELVPIVRALAATFLLQNLGMTAQAILRRNMRFRPLSIIEMSAYILGYCITGVSMALAGFGVWSLVGANLVQGLVSAVAMNAVVRHSYRFTFRWEHYKRLYSFGAKVSVISFLEFLTTSLDTLIIGAVLGARSLGLYNRAQMLVLLPLNLFSTSLSRVLLPAWSSVQDDLEKLKRGYLTIVGVAGAVLLATGIGMAIAAPGLVDVLLGPGWEEAVPILGVLAIATPVNMITHFSGVLLESKGKLKVKLFAQLGYLGLLSGLFWWFQQWGLLGFAVALLVGVLLLNAFYTVVVARLLGLGPRTVAGAYASAVSVGLMTGLAIFGGSRLFISLGLPPAVVLIGLIGVGASVLFASLWFGPQRAALRPLVRRAVGAPVSPSMLSGRIGHSGS